MTWNWKEYNKEISNYSAKQKNLFKSHYCSTCKQTKPCGVLGEKCCSCYFQSEQEQTQEYSDYQKVYQQEVKKQQKSYKQLLLLKNYLGCPQCGSLEVDAYELYEKNRLICQPCQVEKAQKSMKYDKKLGGWYYSIANAISFSEKAKWYKKRWGINLNEWLENFSQLPVNAECAREWLMNDSHLNNCQCLEKEVRKLVELFTGSLRETEEKLKECKCVKSEKFRVDSDNYAWCERCEESIKVASKKRVIKIGMTRDFGG